MTAIDDLIETIAKADSSSWDIADHVAAIPQKGEDGYRPLREVAEEIYERLGVEWAATTLSKYRATAQAFPMRMRVRVISFHAHETLRSHPDKLSAWATKNPDLHMPSATAQSLRGGTSVPKADRDAWKVRFGQAWKVLDSLAENDPVYALTAIDQLARNWKARFPKALAKGATRGLHAV